MRNKWLEVKITDRSIVCYRYSNCIPSQQKYLFVKLHIIVCSVRVPLAPPNNSAIHCGRDRRSIFVCIYVCSKCIKPRCSSRVCSGGRLGSSTPQCGLVKITCLNQYATNVSLTEEKAPYTRGFVLNSRTRSNCFFRASAVGCATHSNRAINTINLFSNGSLSDMAPNLSK